MEAVELDSLIPMERLEQAALMLRVLAHPHRLRMCELLMQRRVSVNELAAHLGIAANAASQHLGIMKAHGIVGAEREGKTVYYRVTSPQPSWLLGCISNHSPSTTGNGAYPETCPPEFQS